MRGAAENVGTRPAHGGTVKRHDHLFRRQTDRAPFAGFGSVLSYGYGDDHAEQQTGTEDENPESYERFRQYVWTENVPNQLVNLGKDIA